VAPSLDCLPASLGESDAVVIAARRPARPSLLPAALTMRFAVAVISPLGYVHSQAFAEVAESLHHALFGLGHESVLSSRLDNRRRRHIVLGANLLPRHPQPLPADAIVVNLEQIAPGSKWMVPAYLDILAAAGTVWDYSRANIDALRTLGIAADLVPIGFVPALRRIQPQTADIDVLFYGSVNERRHRVLEALRARGLRVEAVFGVYGRERDALIARAKLVLNMHYYDAKVFEIVRVSYLLANGICVVSERGSDPGAEAPFDGGIAFAAYDELVDRCVALLADPAAREALATRGQQQFMQMPMAAGLAAAIARLPTAAVAGHG